VAELRSITQRGPDVDHRLLADKYILSKSDRACLDQTCMGAVASKK
jgi:hypothetical protein